jgi:acyl transferase domain-containing protein
VKSNIGHAQAAGGVAGVMKMVLALQHGLLPATLHVDEPSPHVDWSAGSVRLLTEPVVWAANGHPRRTGVSAFGISGTNAHLIIEEAPAAGPETADSGASGPGEAPVLAPGVSVWQLSGRSADGLRGQATRLAGWLERHPGAADADVGWSLATTRAALDHRAVITGTSRDELRAGLAALAAGEPSAHLATGVAARNQAARVGFVFAGQGSQWPGMGRELYAASPVFAAAFDEASALMGLPVADVVLGTGQDHTGQDQTEQANNANHAGQADQTLFAQTGLFALQVGLVALLNAAGVRPAAVTGHSVGEIAAAYCAGVLSLPDACALVTARARLMQDLPAGGAMIAIEASEADIGPALAGSEGRVGLAAVNGPSAVVISGDAREAARIGQLFAQQGRRTRALRVSHAFHSPAMDPVLGPLGEVAERLTHRPPSVPWAGALTGDLLTDCGPGYWTGQARQPVRFADAIATLAGHGVQVFLEIGPDGTLSALGPAAVSGPAGPDEGGPVFIPLQRRDHAGPIAVAGALGRAHASGADVTWAKVLPRGQRVDLPTYAFQRQRYWAAPAAQVPGASGTPSPGDDRFWAAVNEGDGPGLAATLAIDGQRPFSEVLPALAAWRRREQERSAISRWRYRISWTAVPEPEPGPMAGRWLVVAPGSGADAGLLAACVQALATRGADVQMVTGPGGAAGHGELAGVVSLLALDETPAGECPAVNAGLTGTLALIQALAEQETTAPLWILTRGAVAARPGETVTAPVQAQVWGLGRVASIEHPSQWGGLIDLPSSLDAQAGRRLCAVLAGGADEDQVAVRPAGMFARRLTRAPARGPARDGDRPGWTPSGTVLITGGTGAIGGQVARWVAGQGAPRVVLASRSGPAAPGAPLLAAALAGAGSAVTIAACDVADRGSLAALLDHADRTGPALRAVLHTAAVLDDGVLSGLDPGRLATVLTAKATSAAHLDELTADRDLDAFVLFSSAAAVFGSAGQGNYAAANAYLDALAEDRRGRGRPGLSIAWGQWAGDGLAQSSTAVRQRLRRGALPPMDPALAVQALAEALAGPDAALAVMDVDWASFLSTPGAGQAPFLRGLPDAVQVTRAAEAGDLAAGDGQDSTGFARRLAGLAASEQKRTLTELIRAEAAAVLNHPSPSAIGANRPFRELGFDSLTSVELRNRLSLISGQRLPATAVFDYPTPAALAEHLWAEEFDHQETPVALLEELDRLEALVTGTTIDDAIRTRIVARLHGVLATFGDTGTPPGRQQVTQKIDAASDEQIFDFIHKELGRS